MQGEKHARRQTVPSQRRGRAGTVARARQPPHARLQLLATRSRASAAPPLAPLLPLRQRWLSGCGSAISQVTFLEGTKVERKVVAECEGATTGAGAGATLSRCTAAPRDCRRAARGRCAARACRLQRLRLRLWRVPPSLRGRAPRIRRHTRRSTGGVVGIWSDRRCAAHHLLCTPATRRSGELQPGHEDRAGAGVFLNLLVTQERMVPSAALGTPSAPRGHGARCRRCRHARLWSSTSTLVGRWRLLRLRLRRLWRRGRLMCWAARVAPGSISSLPRSRCRLPSPWSTSTRSRSSGCSMGQVRLASTQPRSAQATRRRQDLRIR